MEGLKPNVIPRLTDPEGKGITRIMISTPLAESEVADYLTELAARVEPNGVKVGSYPRWGKKKNTVTLVGRCVSLFPDDQSSPLSLSFFLPPPHPPSF